LAALAQVAWEVLGGVGVGAAAGLGYSLLSKGKQLAIPSGTPIEFRLQQTMTV